MKIGKSIQISLKFVAWGPINNYLTLVQIMVWRRLGPFYWHGWTLIPAWISNYIHYKVWYEITYPFPNFNGAIPHFIGYVYYLSMLGLKLNRVSKRAPGRISISQFRVKIEKVKFIFPRINSARWVIYYPERHWKHKPDMLVQDSPKHAHGFVVCLLYFGCTVCLTDSFELQTHMAQGLYSLKRCLTGIGIPVINPRRPDDRIGSIMGIPVLIRRLQHLHRE